MNDWKTTEFPDAPVDGQLHVDAEFVAWRWDNTNVVWVRESGWRVEKTQDVNAYYIMRTDPGIDGRVPGQVPSEWDALYAKAFIEILVGETGAAYYKTGMTFAELGAFLDATLPTVQLPMPPHHKHYTANAQINIFEVFAPVGSERIIAYNEQYSAARGRKGYNRKKGRELLGMSDTFQIASSFKAGGHYTDGYTEPGKQFLSDFFGITAASSPDSDKIFVFSVTHNSVYRQPRVGSQVGGGNGRWAYDTATGTYVATSAELVVGTPRFFGTSGGGTNRELISMNGLAGTRYFTYGYAGLLVYPLTSGTLRAFLLKPYGVDTLGIGFQITSEWKVVAEYIYGVRTRGTSHRIVTVFDPWDDIARLQRVLMCNLKLPHIMGRGLDDPMVPRKIQFYALHQPSGLRTRVFPQRLRFDRRKCNISVCVTTENSA